MLHLLLLLVLGVLLPGQLAVVAERSQPASESKLAEAADRCPGGSVVALQDSLLQRGAARRKVDSSSSAAQHLQQEERRLHGASTMERTLTGKRWKWNQWFKAMRLKTRKHTPVSSSSSIQTKGHKLLLLSSQQARASKALRRKRRAKVVWKWVHKAAPKTKAKRVVQQGVFRNASQRTMFVKHMKRRKGTV